VQRPFQSRAPGPCHDAPPGHWAKTAEPDRPTSQGVKDHRATSHRHGDPGNSEPADSIARPPTGPQARHSPGIQQLRARTGEGAQTRPAHVSVDATAADMRAALRAAREDCSDLHRRMETRLHPRYGESAVQVNSQCDALTNEFSTLRLAARQKPSRNSALPNRSGRP
jgi:hypothetical protein